MTTPPVAKTVPTVRTHHGDTRGGRVRLARGQDDPDTIAYLKAENAYTEARTAAPGRPAGHGVQRDQGADPGDRPLGADPQGRLLVLHPHGRGPAVRHPLPPRGRRGRGRPTLHRRRLPARRARRSCSTATPRRVTPNSSPWVRSTSARTATCWPTPPTSPATSGSRCGSRTCAPARCSPTRCPTRSTARPGRPTTRRCSTSPSTTPGGPHRVWRHALGAATEDVPGPRRAGRAVLGRGRADPVRAVHHHRHAQQGDHARYGSSRPPSPTGEPVVIATRRQGVEYSVEQPGRDRFLILHNDGAEDFALACTPADIPGRLGTADRAHARHPAGRGGRVRRAPGGLAAPGRADRPAGARGGRGAATYDIAFPEPLYTVGLGRATRSTTPATVRLRYTSLVTPDSIYDYDLVTREHGAAQAEAGPRRVRPGRLRAAPGMGGGRRRHPGADLAGVPPGHAAGRLGAVRPLRLRLVRGRAWTRGSRSPDCRLLDRGFVFAVAHVRGGGEMGRRWYEDGKLLAKRNTFTDFIACADHLVAGGWTAAGPAGGPGRLGRRAADGRGGQPGAPGVRRNRGRGAVRRRADRPSSIRHCR